MRRGMRRRAAIGIALVTIVVTGMSACGTDGLSDEDAIHHVTDIMHARSESAGRITWYVTLDEALPNVQYAAPGAPPARASEALAVGKVVNVVKGAGFVVPGGDGDGVQTSFDDPDVLWKTIHLTVEIDPQVSSKQLGRTVTVGVAINGSSDFENVAQGFRALGTVALLLTKSPVFAYDPSVFATVEDGSLIATVSTDGSLALPFLDAERAAALLRPVRTLSQLSRAANAPDRQIALTREGGVTTRSS